MVASRFQAASLVGAPSCPNAIAWSDENLIAVASGHIVTILNPASPIEPRGTIAVPTGSYPSFKEKQNPFSSRFLRTPMAETEAPVVPTPVPEETQVEEKAASKPASKAKAAPKAKKPAVAKKPKAARSYPSFEEMITEAIKTLKERTGSSQIAIAKCIEDKHKNLPSNFRKLLLIQSKRLVAFGKLVKVKASFKLPSRSSSTAAAAAPVAVKKPAAKSKVAAKPKAATTKAVAKPKAKADGD